MRARLGLFPATRGTLTLACTHPLTGTEICYCILSLTAKMYLGWFLLINVRAFVWLVHVVCTQPNAIPLQVLFVDGSTADETLQGAGAEAR